MIIQLVLKLKKTSNSNILINGGEIVNLMSGNPGYAAPDIVTQIGTTKTSLADLEVIMKKPLYPTKTDDVKTARNAVDLNLTILKGKAEVLVNDPSLTDDERISLAHSGGFKIKGHTPPTTRVFRAVDTNISGVVLLSAKGGFDAHQWQHTTDTVTFTNKIELEPTTYYYTYVTGLTKNTLYAFFHKPIKAKTRTSWEGPIIVMVT